MPIDTNSHRPVKKYAAEFIATFALVFCGTGAIIVNELTNGTITHAGIAITFGLIVTSMIYAVGDISGAHMNPAVTFAFAISGRFKWSEVPLYFISQIAGAILASVILRQLFPDSISLGMTTPLGEPIQSFVLEIILTFFLMFVIIHVATGPKEQGLFAGIAIGGVILLDALFGGPVSGGSMNPARSFAPAFINGNYQHLWIYLTAPFIGAAIAIGAYRFLRS
jgi:aquaporin NIP